MVELLGTAPRSSIVVKSLQRYNVIYTRKCIKCQPLKSIRHGYIVCPSGCKKYSSNNMRTTIANTTLTHLGHFACQRWKGLSINIKNLPNTLTNLSLTLNGGHKHTIAASVNSHIPIPYSSFGSSKNSSHGY